MIASLPCWWIVETQEATFILLMPFWLVSRLVQFDEQPLVAVVVVRAKRSTCVTAFHGICDSWIDPLHASQNATDWPVPVPVPGPGTICVRPELAVVDP